MANTEVGDGMNKEKELDELVERVRNESEINFPPVFEMYATLFSILLSVLLFVFPTMLNHGTGLYAIMLFIMPQYMWAFAFFVAGMTKAVALWFDLKRLRITGLAMSAVLYMILAVCYYFSFPAIGAVTFTTMTVFVLISIGMVRHTKVER